MFLVMSIILARGFFQVSKIYSQSVQFLTKSEFVYELRFLNLRTPETSCETDWYDGTECGVLGIDPSRGSLRDDATKEKTRG